MKKIPVVFINFYFFSLLVILTPFLMLQNFLQNAIGRASRAAIDLDFISIPYVVIIAVLVLILFFYLSRKILSKRRLLFLGFIVLFVGVGQMTADYYFNHTFYDLQHNWHYIAYGLYAYVAYRRFSYRPTPTHKVIFKIFITALLISVFDEFIQVFISNRIFDLGDCGKDLWGAMTGIIFIYFFLEDGKAFPNFRLRNKKIKEYYTNPFSLLCLEVIFAYVFLFVASQISESIYKFQVLLITLIFFIIIFLLIHAGVNKIARWIIRGAILAIIIWVFVAARFGTSGIQAKSPGFINYNGIPLLYFDYMIFPDGSFRTVDKKTMFTLRDKQKIEHLGSNIVLVGTGMKGQGGLGWNDILTTELLYNTFKSKIYQLIKLPNRQACETFNRLKKENKKILFIIHNN